MAFARVGATDEELLVCVCNLSPVPRERYRVGLPRSGRWREALNTDAELYAGSGVGNLGAVEAVEGEYSGQPASGVDRGPWRADD